MHSFALVVARYSSLGLLSLLILPFSFSWFYLIKAAGITWSLGTADETTLGGISNVGWTDAMSRFFVRLSREKRALCFWVHLASCKLIKRKDNCFNISLHYFWGRPYTYWWTKCQFWDKINVKIPIALLDLLWILFLMLRNLISNQLSLNSPDLSYPSGILV